MPEPYLAPRAPVKPQHGLTERDAAELLDSCGIRVSHLTPEAIAAACEIAALQAHQSGGKLGAALYRGRTA